MEESRIIYLHTRYVNGTLTKEEAEEFHSVIRDPRQERFLEALMNDTWESIRHKGASDIPAAQSDKILAEIVEAPQGRATRHIWWRRMAVAASIAAILVTATLLYNHSEEKNGQTQSLVLNDIGPGRNGATLTLSDGRKIRLTDAQNGTLAQETGVSIVKTQDGQVIYEITGDERDAAKVNELSTARGETYRLRLPDGTEIWLNAASSIKYPANFAASRNRWVELSGEAYLEVTTDKKRPFIVRSGTQEIEVLGTHFNVSGYPGQRAIRTTLLEGSVKVSSLHSGISRVLKPGQQSAFDGTGIQVAEADTEESVAWKNGYFNFAGKTLEEAMQEVSRWYDVEVVFINQQLKNRQLAGSISKYGKISTVLKTMELAGALNFTIEEEKVIIK